MPVLFFSNTETQQCLNLGLLISPASSPWEGWGGFGVPTAWEEMRAASMAARRLDEVTLTFGIRIIAPLLLWSAGTRRAAFTQERRVAIEAARE